MQDFNPTPNGTTRIFLIHSNYYLAVKRRAQNWVNLESKVN